MLEPRTPVMILVEASWENQHGALQTAPATMEDRSPGGACIRLKARIPVDTRVKVEGRWQKFTGVTRYCRPDGRDFVVGIQRDPTLGPVAVPAAPKARIVPKEVAPPQEQKEEGQRKPGVLDLAAGLGRIPVSKAPLAAAPRGGDEIGAAALAKIPSPRQRETPPAGAPAAQPEAVARKVVEPPVQGEPAAQAMPGSPANSPLAVPGEPRSEIVSGPRAEAPIEPPPNAVVSGNDDGNDNDNERKSKFMARKWLEMAPWRSKPDNSAVAGDASRGPQTSIPTVKQKQKESDMPPLTPSPRKSAFFRDTAADAAEDDPTGFEVELIPSEDIYRAAGIMMPRKGYSIMKVVEMLNSDHLRSLSKDMKRVAVLMALDAAGVPLDEVLSDARARQQALDAYEAEQKKRAEAEWARKADENASIEAELERIKAHHMARIARNVEAVAREKATFERWVVAKKQEAQSMAEAAELCLKAPAPSAPPAPAREAPAQAQALAKTV